MATQLIMQVRVSLVRVCRTAIVPQRGRGAAQGA
jgi:hypothetical protein